MKHLGHKIAAIVVILAVFLLPFYVARTAYSSQHSHAFFDASGLRHLRTDSQRTHVHTDTMESVSLSAGLHLTAH